MAVLLNDVSSARKSSLARGHADIFHARRRDELEIDTTRLSPKGAAWAVRAAFDL